MVVCFSVRNIWQLLIVQSSAIIQLRRTKICYFTSFETFNFSFCLFPGSNRPQRSSSGGTWHQVREVCHSEGMAFLHLRRMGKPLLWFLILSCFATTQVEVCVNMSLLSCTLCFFIRDLNVRPAAGSRVWWINTTTLCWRRWRRSVASWTRTRSNTARLTRCPNRRTTTWRRNSPLTLVSVCFVFVRQKAQLKPWK